MGFILVRVRVDPESIQGTPGVRREYTLDGKTDYHRATHTHFDTEGKFMLASLPASYFWEQGGTRRTQWKPPPKTKKNLNTDKTELRMVPGNQEL